jgi:sugar/nucleoside kinase (ribokinase family)
MTQAATLANRCAAAVVSQHGNRLTRAKMLELIKNN